MEMEGKIRPVIRLLMWFLMVVLTVEARKHHINKNKTAIFNILEFGAKGDGVSDDSKAFQAAWKAACMVQGATVQIPSNFKFLLKPLTLKGPCMPLLVLQIDGTVLAPPRVGSWHKSSLFQWINFKWLHNFTVGGTGTVDGQGFEWWTFSDHVYSTQTSKKHNPNMKPTVKSPSALRFYSSYHITVGDIKIINSPQCHLKFDNSGDIKVKNVTIFSPENSPNTDGIHLQNTNDVEIYHSHIGCEFDLSLIPNYRVGSQTIDHLMILIGDDCVSIQTGCANVHIHHLNCGPGHGISVGGLGKDRSAACVSNITVHDISIQNTLAGVRIKTWQGGTGIVKNLTFSNIQVSNVKTPIMVDQYYCDNRHCKNQSGAVAIKGIKYDRIIGSYSYQPIHLACSSEIPCLEVDLNDIQLKPSTKNGGLEKGLCWNSYGKSQAPLFPSSVDYCLRQRVGDSADDKIAPLLDHNNVCFQ